MRTFNKLAGFVVLLTSVTGCAISINGDKYKEVSPPFVLEEFFVGDIKAWGIVQNRKGDVVQRFEVDIKGTWKNNTLTLDEKFYYGLGEGVSKRIWTIHKSSVGNYSGSATDIEGPAIGIAHGNAMLWSYEMDLPVGENRYRVRFDDWIWAFDEHTIVNRSYIKKFGLIMAEVTIFMQKNRKL